MKNWTDHIRTLAKLEDNIGKQVAFETSASMLDDLHKENDELRRRAEAAERERDELEIVSALSVHYMSENDYQRYKEVVGGDDIIASSRRYMEKFAIEQQIKALEHEASLWPDDLIERSHVKSLILGSAGQLRQQLNGDNQ